MHWPLLAAMFLAIPAGAPRSVALYPLVARGATPEAMQQLDSAVRIELARVSVRLAAGGPGERFERSCAGERDCLVAYGRSLGADEVLHGEVRALPDSYAVTLRLLDVASCQELGAAAASVNRDVEEMVWATRAQVRRLKAPALYAGRVVLELPNGTRPSLAGREVEPDSTLVLEPGTYGLALTHGGREIEAWLEVRFEQSARVSMAAGPALAVSYEPWTAIPVGKLDLVPPEHAEAGVPFLTGAPIGHAQSAGWSRWPGYAGLGLGAALVAGGVLQQVRAAGIREELDEMGTAIGIRPEDQRAYRTRREALSTTRTSGWLLLGGGAAVTLGAGAFLILAPPPAPGVQVGGTF